MLRLLTSLALVLLHCSLYLHTCRCAPANIGKPVQLPTTTQTDLEAHILLDPSLSGIAEALHPHSSSTKSSKQRKARPHSSQPGPWHSQLFTACIDLKRAILELQGDPRILAAIRDGLQAHAYYDRQAMDYDLLLNAKRNPPESMEDRSAFNVTGHSEAQLQQLANAAALFRDQQLKKLESDMERLKASLAPQDPPLNLTLLPQCLTAHLNTHLYSDARPTLSLMLQYFKRPWMIPAIVEPLYRCFQHGVPMELLVNVDHPSDHQAWAELSYNTSGFVVPVLGANVHELRAYNRMAALARGSIVVMMQDDEVPPPGCAWLRNTIKAFEVWPRLGILGSQRYFMDWHPNSSNWWMHFHDEVHDIPMQFAAVVDIGPMAVRKTAWQRLGGLDENYSQAGMCGICSDFDISSRAWMDGWQVAYMELPDKHQDATENGEGGSHRAGTSGLCWQRQWELCTHVMHARYGWSRYGDPGIFNGSPIHELITEHVRKMNLRRMKRLDENSCPFGEGGCNLGLEDGPEDVGE